MKNIFYTLLISLILVSCGGGGDGDSSGPVNTAPTTPTLIAPTNSKLCIDNTVSFQWSTSIDTEKNPIVYQIQIATDNQFSQIVTNKESSSSAQSVTLEKGKAYYWRVKAMDSKSASSSYSATYSLYTEGLAQSNHLPFLPQIVQPENNATVAATAVALKWTATDSDTNDILIYDVYLGKVNPPTTKIANSVSETSLNVNTLDAATTYYWKVVVKDNKGGETIGQVSRFKTN